MASRAQLKTEGVHNIHNIWVCSGSVTSIYMKNQKVYGFLLNIMVFTLVCEATAPITTKNEGLRVCTLKIMSTMPVMFMNMQC